MAKDRPIISTSPAADRRGPVNSSAAISSQSTQLPTAVRVLLEFDYYPRDLVHAAYRQLLSAASAAESRQSDVIGRNDDAALQSDVSRSSVPYVTAESLARFVEAMMNPESDGAGASALLSPARPSGSLPSSGHVGLGRGEFPSHHRTDVTAGGGDGDLKTDDDGGGKLDTASSSPRAPPLTGDPTMTNDAITTTGASTTVNTAPATTGATAGPAVTVVSAHTTAAAPMATSASVLTGAVATSQDLVSTGGHPATSGSSAESGSDPTERRERQLQRLHALRAENRRLKRRNVCRQCRQKPVDLTLLPCGHFIFCQECGVKFSECPLCMKTVLADVKTFMS